jgi:hypothetical protein
MNDKFLKPKEDLENNRHEDRKKRNQFQFQFRISFS